MELPTKRAWAGTQDLNMDEQIGILVLYIRLENVFNIHLPLWNGYCLDVLTILSVWVCKLEDHYKSSQPAGCLSKQSTTFSVLLWWDDRFPFNSILHLIVFHMHFYACAI